MENVCGKLHVGDMKRLNKWWLANPLDDPAREIQRLQRLLDKAKRERDEALEQISEPVAVLRVQLAAALRERDDAVRDAQRHRELRQQTEKMLERERQKK